MIAYPRVTASLAFKSHAATGQAGKLFSVRHPLPQHRIHPHLPAGAGLTEGCDNVGVNAHGDALFDGRFLLAALANTATVFSKKCLGGLCPKQFREYLFSRACAGRIGFCPFRVLVVGRTVFRDTARAESPHALNPSLQSPRPDSPAHKAPPADPRR